MNGLPPASIQPRRARWALSFADLALLLLGFFVLLQASGSRRDQTLRGIGAQFGASASPSDINLPLNPLFVPGEALLSPEGRARLVTTALPLAGQGEILEIQSFGTEPGQRRFDAWDLAAARLGAVARALQEAGVPQDHLRIAGLAETPDQAGPAGKGQTIRIVRRAQPR
ncbi:OmpA family protein [Sphingobium sp. CR28]|uniref:OmpA family protein n=1 Tax=Sphingobium sp. CR28 TaxID=3400272 RepID=UPI003FEE8318